MSLCVLQQTVFEMKSDDCSWLKELWAVGGGVLLVNSLADTVDLATSLRCVPDSLSLVLNLHMFLVSSLWLYSSTVVDKLFAKRPKGPDQGTHVLRVP